MPFYRLLGPYAHPGAAHTAKTEIWDTITRRGVGGNLAMGIIPMVWYGFVSAFALVLEQAWLLVARPVLALVGVHAPASPFEMTADGRAVDRKVRTKANGGVPPPLKVNGFH